MTSPERLAAEAACYQYLEDLAARSIPFLATQGTGGGSSGSAPSVSHLHPNEWATMQMIKIQVLGSYPDGSIDVFSEELRRVHRIPNIARFSYPELILFAGTPARDYVTPSRDSSQGKKTMEEVKNSIALLASQISLADQSPVGQGVWNADGQITVISGGQAAIFEPKTNALTDVTVPRVGRQILDFGSGDEWINLTNLRNYINLAAGNPAWGQGVFLRVAELFRNWYWQHPIDATVAAALVGSTWIQTLWPWRPLVIVTGPASSGKSMFLDDCLRRFFGRMAAWIAKPSEAAVRQRVGNRSVTIILDEFEGDQKRQAILELFRASSRGAEIFRGSADQRGRRFIIRHIPWMGNIESGLQEEADKNRVITLKLERPPSGKHGHVTLPSDDDLFDLGQQLLAVALVCSAEAMNIFSQIKTTLVPGVHGRLIECYSVPAAFYSAVFQHQTPKQILELFLAGKGLATPAGGDESDLVRCILDSHVVITSGHSLSVGEILSDEEGFMGRREALERHGIALVSSDPGPRRWVSGKKASIFVIPSTCRRFLLKNTLWASKDIGQLLERLPGATYGERVVAGKRVHGWLLPFDDHVTVQRDDPPIATVLKQLEDFDPPSPDPIVGELDI